VFALCPAADVAERAGAAMVEAFRAAGLASDLFLSAVNTTGSTVLARED
jgi:hypothetical protein